MTTQARDDTDPAVQPFSSSVLQPGVEAPLALLRRLEWRVRHAVETVLSGEYRSAFRGRGMEFDQVVKYEFGDDVRDIDWNVTARLGDPYRKKFIEEREVALLIVFEDSPSLQFGSAALSKREALLELAGLVMLLGAVNRDRVGFVHATPDGNLFRQPVRGRGPILHAAATLLSRPAPELSAPGSRLSTSANIPWRLLHRAMPKHTILVWLGDFPARLQHHRLPDGRPVGARVAGRRNLYRLRSARRPPRHARRLRRTTRRAHAMERSPRSRVVGTFSRPAQPSRRDHRGRSL
jgi:uncharacterized protein (DUF58 family)